MINVENVHSTSYMMIGVNLEHAIFDGLRDFRKPDMEIYNKSE